MLYVTTRNTGDAFTTHRVLTNNFGSDGGCFVPFRMPVFDAEQLTQLKDKTFNQTVAEILNSFYSLQLSGWDLDFGVGRNLVRISTMNHRIVVAELWHNLADNYTYVEELLMKKIATTTDHPAAWPRLSVKIAVLFGVYGQMLHDGLLNPGDIFDFSVGNDDFVTPMAAMYCRNMGMPVNTIVCTCDESRSLWDFINRGAVNTASIDTRLQAGLERLLHCTLGCGAAGAFAAACAAGAFYSVSEEELPQMNASLFCSVAGKDRGQTVINSLYRTNAYIIDNDAALCYGGLQDYRAKVGDSQLTVILAEKTPLSCVDEISAATGLNAGAIKKQIKA